MKNPFYGFLGTYFGLIILSLLVNLYFDSDIFISTNPSLSFLSASSLGSLTHLNGEIFNNYLPQSFILFSLFITQGTGIAILSILLWFYWQLFGNNQEKKYNIKRAVRLTIIISVLVESFLFIFFLYIIPTEIVENNLQKKILTTISLSINSFNNAGFPFIRQLIPYEFYLKNYILQLGIIGGAALGNLGIFVINELFSPLKLRERLNDHTVDWSIITKISVYGAAIILSLFSLIHFFQNYGNPLNEINIMESIITSIYNVASFRGFGFYLQENSNIEDSLVINLFVVIFGSGPFSTGGGLTLLCLLWMFTVLWKNNNISQIATFNLIAKNLIIYNTITFSTLTIMLLIAESGALSSKLILNQCWLFFNNNLLISPSTWQAELIKSFTIIAGRISFIVACFMTLKQQNRN